MQIKKLNIQFHTPAFLGDATQSGRWRTPPFKAQLRQWWRVAYAAEKRFVVNVAQMREAEGLLLGHAWLENDRDAGGEKISARKSEVRLRLSHWSEGKEKTWQAADTGITHPEVPKQVGAHLYMGFGPLEYNRDKRTTVLKKAAAIQAQEKAELSIAYPDAEASRIESALHMMSLYGTVGGRSRNGWGSYSLDFSKHDLPSPMRPWLDCMAKDWPHAIGLHDDGRPLIWQTKTHKDWAALMKTLAQIKIAVRTKFVFRQGSVQQPEDRHWLSYPVTNHAVANWGNNARLPNTLRLKVRPTADGQLVGVIFHVPHKPPADFRPDAATLERIWRQVHSQLDQTPDLQRIAA